MLHGTGIGGLFSASLATLPDPIKATGRSTSVKQRKGNLPKLFSGTDESLTSMSASALATDPSYSSYFCGEHTLDNGICYCYTAADSSQAQHFWLRAKISGLAAVSALANFWCISSSRPHGCTNSTKSQSQHHFLFYNMFLLCTNAAGVGQLISVATLVASVGSGCTKNPIHFALKLRA